MNEKLFKKLNKIYSKYQKKMKSNGISIMIENEDKSFKWSEACGDLEEDQNYLIASVTKMFTVTVLLNLIEERKLSFEDKIISYLPDEYCQNLHTYKGIDYTSQLTIYHLMTQTSGLPDYFTESVNGELYGNELLKSDCEITIEEIVRRTQNMDAKFVPGSKKRAYYSDANWDLFLPIIENVSGMSILDCYQKYIFDVVDMKKTYLFTKGMKFDFTGIWIDDNVYKLPKIAPSWPTSGSIVSNNNDMIKFLKAFWGGKLFKTDLMQNNKYFYTQFFPLEYGLGNMRFRYPGVPVLLGHSGSTGVICYYSPKYKVYISGCINEVNEVKATRMMAEFASQFSKI